MQTVKTEDGSDFMEVQTCLFLWLFMQTGKTEDGSDFMEVQTCLSLLCLHIPKVPFHQTIIVFKYCISFAVNIF